MGASDFILYDQVAASRDTSLIQRLDLRVDSVVGYLVFFLFYYYPNTNPHSTPYLIQASKVTLLVSFSDTEAPCHPICIH
jgi:hypothetical protein